MVEDERAHATRDIESARVVLAVPLERTSTFSSRRTRSAVAGWLLLLVGIVAVGVVAWLPDGERASNSVAEAAATQVPVVGLPPTGPHEPLRVVSSRGPAGFPRAVPTRRHTFGEDGLIGGIVFGDNVPRLSQADIERDGYRYYRQLLAHQPSVGQ